MTETAPPAGLPAPVAETRAALLAAARSGAYEALQPLIGEPFSYTFGAPVDGGAIAYWQELERTSPERPLETLAAILEMPYTLSGGIYVWPFAYDVRPEELTEYELELLEPIAGPDEIEGWERFGGYVGWRAGIEPDGDWIYFIAGD